MSECPHCGTNLKSHASVCPGCGAEKVVTKTPFLSRLIMFIIFLTIGYWIFNIENPLAGFIGVIVMLASFGAFVYEDSSWRR